MIWGIEQLGADLSLARHRHGRPYLTLVLDGRYEEAGDHGRRRVGPGDILIHAPFAAHNNKVARSAAAVLNLPLAGWDVDEMAGCSPDADAAMSLAGSDLSAAAQMIVRSFQSQRVAPADWPDQLAADIEANPRLSIGQWAFEHDLTRETVSRGFSAIFGASPKRFRAEARARAAWRAALKSNDSLSEIAADYGFSDQPHMTRAVVALTGLTPGAWRATKREGAATETVFSR